MIPIKQILQALEEIAPLELQESYDNCGLLVGDSAAMVHSVLVCIDITEEVIDEAIRLQSGLIISHHPLIFTGLKNITTHHPIGKIVLRAIQNNIAIYAAHTNFDNIIGGVNQKICSKLNLQNTRILHSSAQKVVKLATYVPLKHVKKVRQALFDAGAGVIGNYDCCTYNIEGTETFRALEGTHPFVGEKGVVHTEPEIKIETVLPHYLLKKTIQALLNAHPYEEVAYDVYELENTISTIGAGMIGQLVEPIETKEFLRIVKQTFGCQIIKHTEIIHQKISKVAVCGGAGIFLLNHAIQAQADIFITGDIKYHDFFNANKSIIVADIGHYESEQFTKEIFYDILTKKFINFAVHISHINSNPVKYF